VPEDKVPPESPQSRDAEEAFAADYPLAKLPPPAREMVAAATRLILRDGYAGLTLRAVAAEADVYADSIRYYFGGKSGLLRAVALNLSHDLALSVVDSVGAIDDEGEPSRVVAEVNKPIAEDTDSYRVYWELLPHILADPEWMVREAEDYEWYRRLYARAILRRPVEFGELPDPSRTRSIASVLIAVGDGLALQKMLDPHNVDLSEIFQVWADIVRPVLLGLSSTDTEAHSG
jgi:AcrR family transcriptional regulator